MTASKWMEVIEHKAFRGKLWVAFGMEHFARRVWEYFTIKKALARSVLVNVGTERQDETEGRWQQDSPYREELEVVRHSSDLRLEGLLMRRAHYAGRSGDWENHLDEFPKRWQAQRMGKCKSEGMLQRGRSRKTKAA